MSEEALQPSIDTEPRDQRGLLAVILWACFLGSSWTWVIGMLFPILLLRDYGVWGWVVFALPNVIGAGAFGFIIATREVSRSVLRHHGPAAVRFSDFTIAYHVFAVGWVYLQLFGSWGVFVTALVALVVWMLAMRRTSLAVGAAVVVTLISLAMLITWLTLGETASPGSAAVRLSTMDLLMFAPAALVGFALCPYLDLTFHRARQATAPLAGRAAFALGFGGVFLAMIVFSLLYAPLLRPLLEPGGTIVLSRTALIVLGIHLTLQAGLTVGLHLHEVSSRRGHEGLHRVLALAVAGGALAYWALSDPSRSGSGLVVGEVVYRGFLLLYGVVFPAYVWLCMIPTRRPIAARARFAVFAVTLLMTLPMAYLGFITGPSWWILLTLGMFVIGRAAVECLPPLSPTPVLGELPGASEERDGARQGDKE